MSFFSADHFPTSPPFQNCSPPKFHQKRSSFWALWCAKRSTAGNPSGANSRSSGAASRALAVVQKWFHSNLAGFFGRRWWGTKHPGTFLPEIIPALNKKQGRWESENPGSAWPTKKNLRRQNYYESCGGVPHHKKPQVISPTSSHITNLKSYHQPQVISPTAIAVHWRQNSLGVYICDLIQNLPATGSKIFSLPKSSL